MKKVIKAVCCILAAVILVGGGYVAGQRAKQSSIVSALPKNILDMPNESNEPSESAEPESKPSEDVPEPKEDVRIINRMSQQLIQRGVQLNHRATQPITVHLHYTLPHKKTVMNLFGTTVKSGCLKYRTATADIIHCLTKM